MTQRDLSFFPQRPAARFCCVCGHQIRLTRAALEPWTRHCTDCGLAEQRPQRRNAPRPEHAPMSLAARASCHPC